VLNELNRSGKRSGCSWIEEVPGVNCQESSREELLVTLRIALAEALELNRTDIH